MTSPNQPALTLEELKALLGQLSPEDIAKLHVSSDVDYSPVSLHHSIGGGPNQAAAGNHGHDADYAALSHTHPYASSTSFPESVSTYTPTWTVNGGGAPSVGNGSLTGRYRVSGKLLWFKIVLAFGSTTSGGSTEWFFTLPPGFTASSNGEQLVPAKGYSVGYSDWSGYALIIAGETRLRPYLPRSISNAGSGWVRNCDATNATGTGVPQVPGSYSFINGASLTVEGTIEVA